MTDDQQVQDTAESQGPEGEQQVSPDTAADASSVARVLGKPVKDIPQDLYIPPDALAVFLEAFEGPLDLLLYLIRRQNMDILDIDVSEITRQYMDYINAIEAMRFELAAEYLVMAATLAEIKSRMLLPRQESEDEEEVDPRAELIRRLQQYERFKKAAEDLDELPRMERDTFATSASLPRLPQSQIHPDVELRDMLLALRDVIRRADLFTNHHVEREKLSTRERMSHILSSLSGDAFVRFESLFTIEEGRLGVVVTFLATLELVKEQLIEVVQGEVLGSIHVRARAAN
ncbi:segregation/condensation protein A [Marinobacter halodurans]|uniref:Segregation and condensation protein A n=1 Tax=Marinobacter halodurans TaxID=2528979 RepID=A0ABY1ZRX2_9GAMM|nr:segregation/condensation protein A [Marinobacter halodurans]TBW59037.1 segregation/condensation protein A [Marinobacter halodurans]